MMLFFFILTTELQLSYFIQDMNINVHTSFVLKLTSTFIHESYMNKILNSTNN